MGGEMLKEEDGVLHCGVRLGLVFVGGHQFGATGGFPDTGVSIVYFPEAYEACAAGTLGLVIKNHAGVA